MENIAKNPVVVLREALVAMVYVHPCNCGSGIPQGQCARCRAVSVLGFDPAVLSAREEQTRPTPADNRGASSPPSAREVAEA